MFCLLGMCLTASNLVHIFVEYAVWELPWVKQALSNGPFIKPLKNEKTEQTSRSIGD